MAGHVGVRSPEVDALGNDSGSLPDTPYHQLCNPWTPIGFSGYRRVFRHSVAAPRDRLAARKEVVGRLSLHLDDEFPEVVPKARLPKERSHRDLVHTSNSREGLGDEWIARCVEEAIGEV